ncbi:hypothetical protein [Desulfatiglans anilini]|uniref:hypothetical protein n=1 Tax=Desulfatiglans anilini TaxID=90728 RepID=UPI000404AF8A|nr:hypothetical protein [Desulfatiglans anilini]
MHKSLWWLRQGVMALAALFFLLFGVYVLIAAYHLNDPFSFVMTFFASNLMILISLALLAGFVFQMFKAFKKSENEDRPDGPVV